MTTRAKSVALAVVATFIAAPVLAADLTYNEPAPSYDAPASSGGWSGAYVGGHAGMGSDHLNPFRGGKGFVGGVQAGYNADLQGAVVGGEIELSHMGDTKVRVPGGDLKERHRLAVKAKAGMPMGDSTLLYGTGGMAMTNMRDGSVRGPDGWKPGWLAGAGVEQKLNSNISARVEYNYVRTNDVRVFNGTTTQTGDIGDHSIKAGVNYKF